MTRKIAVLSLIVFGLIIVIVIFHKKYENLENNIILSYEIIPLYKKQLLQFDETNDKIVQLDTFKINENMIQYFYTYDSIEGLFSAISIDNKKYVLGKIDMGNKFSSNMNGFYTFENSSIADNIYRYRSLTGAAVYDTKYIRINDNIPYEITLINNAEEFIFDNNRTGIVSTVGTIPQTTIYILEENSIKSIDLSTIPKAVSIFYDQNLSVFKVNKVNGEINNYVFTINSSGIPIFKFQNSK